MKNIHDVSRNCKSENADQCARLLARWESQGIHSEVLIRVRERLAFLSRVRGDVRPSTFSWGAF